MARTCATAIGLVACTVVMVSGCTDGSSEPPAAASDGSSVSDTGETGPLAWTRLEPTGGVEPSPSSQPERSTPRSPTSPSSPTTGSAAPSPAASPTAHLGTQHGRGSEGAPSESPSPFALPAPPATQDGPLLSGPLPERVSRTDGLFPRYPRRALPPVPGSRVAATSLARQGSAAQVTLSATTARAAGRVLLFYRLRLGELGFTEIDDGRTGALEASFTRGDDAVAVTVTPRASGSTYTVFATAEVAR